VLCAVVHWRPWAAHAPSPPMNSSALAPQERQYAEKPWRSFVYSASTLVSQLEPSGYAAVEKS